MVSDVRKPPYTEKRGGQWQYRRRVPDELVPFIGRREYRESLRTPDIEIARTRAALRNAEVAVEFEQARRQLQAQPHVPVIADELADDVARYIREAVRVWKLDEDESQRQSRSSDSDNAAYDFINDDLFRDTVEALQTGATTIGPEARSRMAALLETIGVAVAQNSPAWDVAAYKATEGLNQALADIGKRRKGRHVVTPEMPALPLSLRPPPIANEKVAGDQVLTLGTVIGRYVDGLPENEFKRKVRRCLQLFAEMVGRDTEVTELRQLAVTVFLRDICKLPHQWARRFDAGESIRDMMEEEPEKVMSPTTYEHNYRAPLGTFLKAAARDYGDDGFRSLTTEGIRYTGNREAGEDQQRALIGSELKTLFEGEAFARIASDPEAEPLYWLMVVSLFTGARPRELCQINPQHDFGQEGDHWFIDITKDTPAGKGVKKSIKTNEARRIPLHRELIRLGFHEYLKKVKAQGAGRLFPTWRVKGGNPFAAHYKLPADLLREVGLYTDDARPGAQVTGVYVLRKTFITACRNQGVVSKEITGHSDGSTTAMQDRHYIFGQEPFQRKCRELEKLVMPVRLPLRNVL